MLACEVWDIVPSCWKYPTESSSSSNWFTKVLKISIYAAKWQSDQQRGASGRKQAGWLADCCSMSQQLDALQTHSFSFLTQRTYSCSNFIAISSLVLELLKKCRVRYRVGHPVCYSLHINWQLYLVCSEVGAEGCYKNHTHTLTFLRSEHLIFGTTVHTIYC